jgi:hypothetical protein
MINYLLDIFSDKLGLNTKTDNIDIKSIRGIVKNTTKYCINTFGINNRKRTEFTISICKQKGGEKSYGSYCPYQNKITIHYNNCNKLKDIIQTVIHEYTHYLQPVKSSYNKLLQKYGYDDHPMEIEARDMEKNYYQDCWNKIKNKI